MQLFHHETFSHRSLLVATMPLSHLHDPENSASRSRRQRIALACGSCRARKTKCNGARPSCGTCVDFDFVCNYSRPIRRHENSLLSRPSDSLTVDGMSGPSTESRLHAIEQTLQLLAANGGVPPPTRTRDCTTASVLGLTSPSSTADIPFDSSSQQARPPHGADQMLVSPQPHASQNDTVDGMVVITFADDVTTACFG